jgi:protein involved in polysaccharide export with SLBB domain
MFCKMRAHSYARLALWAVALLAAPNTRAQEETGAEEGPAAAATPVPAALAAPVAPVTVPAAVIRPSSSGGALSSGESDYVLVVGDVVELNVFREPDLTTQATIARDGTVQLPLVREVKLAGLTIRDARELLRGLYDKQFLVDPQVFLNVVKYAERKFTIMGQVARPGSYELQGGERIDLLEAIGLAGGFTRIADRGRVIIQRKEAGEVKAIKANAKRMADGKTDPLEVQPGDVITVKESWF